jgi:predicted nucleic acid-binding protein
MSALQRRDLRRVFTDTSAIYALADPRDNDHAEAIEIRRLLTNNRSRLYTSNFVLAEAHALLLGRLGRSTALQVLLDIDRSNTTIERAGDADEQRARAIVIRYDDKDFSLTDAISFAIMERLGMTQAFSFDRDFAQYGFDILRP